ncbi:MAG: PAS domain S-box protein [Azospirillum sp.]|nr:PAS domain S-box protein [Azospirillum sp.]
MIVPPLPADEEARLTALGDYGVLDTPSEPSFDRITRLASEILGFPIVLISLVDRHRQWFKSKVGLDADETPRDLSFCGHAILSDQVLVVEDASKDARFHDNPLVAGDPAIRFYAGAPLRARGGYRLGTLCAIDRQPRRLLPEQVRQLSDLAQIVVDTLDLRLALDRSRQELETVDRARAALVDSEARLRAIFDTVVDGIITIDERGIVRSFNPAAVGLFGYDPSEVLGHNVSMLMPRPYRAEHDGYLSGYLRSGEAKVIGVGREVSGLRKNGTVFPMDLAVSEVRLGKGRLFTGIVRDITERKRTERLKAEFIATVSHELRTPLTSIKGTLKLIIRGVGGEVSAKTASLVDIAYRNVDRLAMLVNDILDIEKIESGRMEFHFAEIDIGSLLDHAAEANKDYARQLAVGFAIKPLCEPLLVSGDFDRLMQVLANLLSNAAKFSPAGSTVEVSAGCCNGDVRITVADRGPGVPEEFRSRIFGKFAQADATDNRQKGGTGLGLSIARTIVERHGGTIGFEDRPGGGAFFHVDLPAVSSTPEELPCLTR